MLRSLLFALLTLSVASARAEVPVEVSAGGDVAAWRALAERDLRGDEAIDAWRGFIQAYPASPLAELAWGALHDAGVEPHGWPRDLALQVSMDQLQRSWTAHQRALAREPEQVIVAPLYADGTRDVTLPAKWTGTVAAGSMWSAAGLDVGLSARAERGPVGVVARLDAGAAPLNLGLGARLSMTPWGPFLEACATTSGSLSAVGGARYELAPSLWLEGSAGVATLDRAASPVLRVELAHTLASAATIVRQ